MSRASRRRALAEEAARLMHDEGVREYYTAKHRAADNLLGMRRSDTVSLPSNREIRAALVARAEVLEGLGRKRRLRHLRQVAAEVMVALQLYEPRLIGSVASGAIHASSDIDIQLFTHHPLHVEATLFREGYDAERVDLEVFKDGAHRRYLHYHFDADGAHVELSVYGPEELHRVALSSIDGKPIDRVPIRRVRHWLQRGA